MYKLYMYVRLLIFTIKFIANDITEILLKVAININPTIYIFISQKTIAIHRYRELQNYLQIYTCTITVTEKQKWTQGLARSTHTFIYDFYHST